MIFPSVIEDDVPVDAPVGARGAFVDALDFAKLGVDLNPNLNRMKDVMTDLEAQKKESVNLTDAGGKTPDRVCADAGYADAAGLKKIVSEINAVVPSQRQAREEKGPCPVGPFNKKYFVHDHATDEYVCPEGKRLKFSGIAGPGKTRYQAKGFDCQACAHFGGPDSGQRAQSLQGRRITRLSDEDFKEQLEADDKLPEHQAIYKWRKETVGYPFGHMLSPER